MQKKELKNLARFKQEQTFELVAMKWHTRHLHLWSLNHSKHLISRLKHNVFPFIGKYPISSLSVHHILACIQKVEEREMYDMAYRILQIIGQVMRYAMITRRAERDTTVGLKGAMKKYRKGYFAAISSDELPDLLKSIDRNEPRLFGQTIWAINLMLLTFVELVNSSMPHGTNLTLKKQFGTYPPNV